MQDTQTANDESSLILKRVRQATRTLRNFIEVQESWLAHSRHASRHGFFIEAIELSHEQMRLIIRNALWMESHLEVLRNRGNLENRFLLRLFAHPDEMLPRSIRDGELIGAANQYGLLSQEQSEELNELFGRISSVVQDALESKGTNERQAIATRLMDAVESALQILRRQLAQAAVYLKT